MIKAGDLLWTPSPEWLEQTHAVAFVQWLREVRGLEFPDYDALWHWSVNDLEAFWQAIWDYFELKASVPHERVLGRREMPGAQWFPGARLNYAENLFAKARPGQDALLCLSETQPLTPVSTDVLWAQVRRIATALRAMGVQPGDRVVAYLPNIPQAVAAMLATTAIGAIWASCSPDFGTRGVLDRLTQLEPTVLFCVDGYRYGGKAFDRRAEVDGIVAALPSLKRVVVVPHLDADTDWLPRTDATTWSALLDGPAVPAETFHFEQVAFDAPLWILFSSGTTGLPKPIVHGHGGILLEMAKLLHLHVDFHRGQRIFFYTTTGWMMWNYIVTSMLAGVTPVLYDGNPAYPTPDLLWKMVEQTRASYFGCSPTFVEIMVKAGIVPRERFDLSSLRAVMPAGSPVTPECNAWFHDNVKRDVWVATGSGGTDVCSGLVGGFPTLPEYAGEIQARHLGVAAYAFDEQGKPVVDQVGELVITQPMPSMPVMFWNDPDGTRYRESYFDLYPGVWRHGDFFRINERGGCFVLGRSDATLNRHGVRIGTAEIYRTLMRLPEVADALIVNLDLPGGAFFMPLFVKLAEGMALDARIETAIRDILRREYTPRHVPDRILQVPAIPMTLTGKKMEVPVRRILAGMDPDKAANRAAMMDPRALDAFIDYARDQTDYRMR